MNSTRAPIPNRRAMMAGALILATSGAAAAAFPAGIAPPPDPHPERLPELLRLWAEHKRTAFGWGHPGNSPEHDAAEDAVSALWDACDGIVDLPLPRTAEGLSAFVMAATLANEGRIGEGDDKLEHTFGRLILALVAATGVELPADFGGVYCRVIDGKPTNLREVA